MDLVTQLEWSDAIKFVVLVTDAPPHGLDGIGPECDNYSDGISLYLS